MTHSKNNQKEKIINFVDKLSTFDVDTIFLNVENIYKEPHKKENLQQYLLHLADLNPQIMLVGEAPGYKGCGKTGIPFTDEVQLKNPENCYLLGELTRNLLIEDEKEQSASVIWEILTDKKIPVLLWNAFPFHPYTSKGSRTNRKPSIKELEVGSKLLYELIDIFDIKTKNVYGVGRTAQKVLHITNEANMVRHPAYGGKTKCQNKLLSIL